MLVKLERVEELGTDSVPVGAPQQFHRIKSEFFRFNWGLLASQLSLAGRFTASNN